MRLVHRFSVFLAMALASQTATADITLVGGDYDGCGTSADTASPSDDLLDALAANGIGPSDLENFDEGSHSGINRYVAHTFDFQEVPRTIIGANFRSFLGWGFSTYPMSGEESDGVALGFATPSSADFEEATAWKRTFDACPAEDPDSDSDLDDFCPPGAPVFNFEDPGLSPGHAYYAFTYVADHDLDALPLIGGGTTSIIADLNTHGFLDVVMGDDLCSNFYELELYFDDSDGDGVTDDEDNCISVPNASQADHDADGVGTACDVACDDGFDNDSDSDIDYPDDVGCLNASSETESPECDDGVDNDGDQLVDYPDDPQCAYPWWGTENYTEVCGIGFELVALLPLLMWARRLRKRRGPGGQGQG